MGIVWLIACIFFPAYGLYMLRRYDQRQRDRQRRTYKLFFPAELTQDTVTAWIRSISGTLRSSNTRLLGVPTVAFEMWASNAGIVHRLKVPWQHADYVIGQLLALVPGLRYEPEDEFPRRLWTRIVEVGLTHSSRQLRIYNPAETATTLLASVQALETGEAVLMQWVVTPAIPSHPPIHKQARSHHISPHTLLSGDQANRDEVRDRRDKLAEPNVMAVLRVAAVAETDARADHLVYRVRAALASTRSAAVRFQKRLATKDELQKRVDHCSASLMFPMQLSATELVALIAWPLGNPFVAGLPPTQSRQFPPVNTVPDAGLVVGQASFPGSERRIAIPYLEAMMHTHVLGKTGTGKSALLGHMARQIMEAGYGLILMETEGNLYQSVLDYMPYERVKDTILLDVGDESHPVGFNVLDQGNPLTVIDEVIDLFMHRYGKDGMGVWAQEYIYHGLRTLAATPGTSFTDIATILLPRTVEEIAWVDSITRNLTDPELRRWWQRHDNRDRKEQQQRADPVLSRIWQLVSRPELRHIMGQTQSTFQVSDVLEENKILLVNLKGVSRETASLAGTLLMNAIWHAAKSTTKERASFLILDEFADFMDLPIDTETMLAQARKHQLGMILANQHMSQLKPTVREAVVTNTRNKVIFQTNAEDARTIQREISSHIDTGDFINLPAYEAITRIQTPTGSSSPISIRTYAPAPALGWARDAIQASRKTYGRPIKEVRSEIENRHTIKRPSRRRPAIGTEDLGPEGLQP